MTLIFLILWLFAIVLMITTRFTCISILILSSVLYSSPIFWTPSPNDLPTLVWIVLFVLICSAQLVESSRKVESVEITRQLVGQDLFINQFFNFASISVFLLVIVLSGGPGVFFEGKYGATPGQSILIYYSWNSLLILTTTYNVICRKFTDPFNLICLLQVLLIFVGGDRTIPVLYIVVNLRMHLNGISPVALMTGKRLVFGLFMLVIAPMLLVSKTIYTLLPVYGFSFSLISAIFNETFFLTAAKDFEPSHTHRLLVYATTDGVDFDLFDLIPGLLAVLPGSSALGVNPHVFSNAMKVQYFETWSDSTGVGGNFWAQAWVVGGMVGVVVFCLGLILILNWFERVINGRQRAVRKALVVTLTAVIGFYIQRNSLEQTLSFAGRYTSICLLVWTAASVSWMSFPKRKAIR